MTYRSRPLLDLCHEMNTCMVRIPDVCRGHSPEGLEPAHANWSWANRGMGHKADDLPAAACHACHQALDPNSGTTMSREDRERYYLIGEYRTVAFWLANGWLTITPRNRRMVSGGER